MTNHTDLFPIEYPVGAIQIALADPGADWIAADGLAKATATYPVLAAVYTEALIPPVRSFFHEDDRTVTGQTSNTDAAVCVMSPNGRYLLVEFGISPWLQVYDMSSGTMTVVTSPSNTPASAIKYGAWSGDSRYFAVGYSSSPYFDVFDMQSGTPVRLTRPTSPGGACTGLAFSPDGLYIAFQTSASPYIHFYSMSTGSPVKLSNPGTLPNAQTPGNCSWSPNSRYLAMGNGNNSPYVLFYDLNTGSPVKLSNPASLPAVQLSQDRKIVWNNTGRYVAMVMNGTSPYAKVYDFNSGAPVACTGSFNAPSNTPLLLGWIGDIIVAVTLTSSTYVTFTAVAAGVMSSVTNGQGQPAAAPNGNATLMIDPAGRYVGFSYGSSPYAVFYEIVAGAITSKFTVTSNIFGSSPGNWFWSPDGDFIIAQNSSGDLKYSMIPDINPWSEFGMPLVTNGWVKTT